MRSRPVATFIGLWTRSWRKPSRRRRPHALANLLGSVAFGVSAVAGYVVPASGDVWNAEVSNVGTLGGAICFLVGAILLLPPRAVPASRY